jgi:hypothetical protein
MGWLIFLALCFGLPLLLFLAAFVVGCIERHPVRMFDSAQLRSASDYMQAVARDAYALGYQWRDGGIHTKFREKIQAGLLLSSDRLTLAIVGDGHIAGMRSRKSILISKLRNGQIVMTVDEAGTAELDPLTTRQIIMNASFNELHRAHVAKLMELPPAEPFPPEAGWEQIDQLYRARSDRVVERGLASYTDPRREFFRYTMWGSFRTSILHGIGQLLVPANYWRTYKRRPG